MDHETLQQKIENLRDDAKTLSKEIKFVNNSIILQCQKNCLSGSFREPFGEKQKINDFEKTCLTKCIDQQIFFDNATFELDSANQMATSQGKPKKFSVYMNRRIDDLSSEV